MVVPDLIKWKHLLLLNLLLLATITSTQNFSTRQDFDTEIQEQENEDVVPGFVDKFYNFFSKMKGFVTGQNPEAERRLEKFRKQIFKESRSMNQELHKLEGNVRYSKGGSLGPNYRFAHDHPITQSRKKREHPMDFILHQDTEDNMVLSNIIDMKFLAESDGARRSMDLFVHNDIIFFVVVNSELQARIYSFDSKFEKRLIHTFENVTECKFNVIEDISLLLMICIPPLDSEETSIVTVSKLIKFADGKYYLFRHQKLRIENPSTTQMWYQNQDSFLMIGQKEKFSHLKKSVYQTESKMYHWTGSYFNQIEEGAILPGNNVTSLLHFHAGNNHYLAMANHENNKGDHNIFSNIFKYSLSKERYEMWHRIPTKGAIHFAAFTLGTGIKTENFLVVANYCEDDINGKCDQHTNSVIYKIESEKFSQFQCIETHGAVQWLAIEVGTGVLLGVANSLTGAAFYQYNGWKFIQVDVNIEKFPALGPGISSIKAIPWNGNYYMGVTNSNNEDLSLLFSLEFETDTHLKRFHSVASKWCSGGTDFIKNGPQPKDLMETMKNVHWVNSSCTFTNAVTFKKSLLINNNATTRWIYIKDDDVRIPETTVPLNIKANNLNASLDIMTEMIKEFVPLSHSWPDGLQLTRLEVESGSIEKVTAKTIDGVSVDPDDLILIKATSITVEQLHLVQGHLQSDATLKYLNDVLWSDLVTLSGNHWLINDKTFSGNISAVHLEVEGKFQNISFGLSQILDASAANYTGGIICDEIVSPGGVFAQQVASHDLQQLQQDVVTNDVPVHIGTLRVNSSVEARGIISKELAGQNLEDIFKHAFMTNLIEKQVILYDHRVNSASMLNIHVGDVLNGLRIPTDVLINSPVLEYKFDSATFPNLKASSLAVNEKLNDIKVINGSLDVLSTKEREVQVITASKNFEHLNLTVGMILRNQTFEDVDFISETRNDLRKRRSASDETFEDFDFISSQRDDLRNRRSASTRNNLCPYKMPMKFFMMNSNEKMWQQLLLTVRTTVNSQLLLQQLTYLSNFVCLTPQENMIIDALQHNVHCTLSDMTIMDNILGLFKNKCESGQQKEMINKERLQRVKGLVDRYRQRLEKNVMKLLVNPLYLVVKQNTGSNLGNQLFLVDLLLQLFYNDRHLNENEIYNKKNHKEDFESHETMINNHIWYLLKNMNILYKVQLVNFHSIFMLKDDAASSIAKENIDNVINFEMGRIIKTMSIIEIKNRNLCYLLSDVENYLNSKDRKNIVFMLQMYKNKILSSLLENMQSQKDLPNEIHLYSHDEKEDMGYMDGGNAGSVTQKEESKNRQSEESEKVEFLKHSIHKRQDSTPTSASGFEDADVVYITDQQGNEDVLYISKNSTLIMEMLSNSRMVKKFMNRFDQFLSLDRSVNSTEKLNKLKSTTLVTYLERLINVLNKTLTNANDYILRWEDTEVQHVDIVVDDALRLTEAFQYQLPDKVWEKIDYIKQIIPIAKNKTDHIQKILLEKLYNTEHSDDTENCNSDESCLSISQNNITEQIKEDLLTFYILNNNFVSDDVKNNSDSCAPKSQSLLEYLKAAQDYLSCVWEFAWFPVYVDDTKENSIVSSKISEIASETEHLLDTMSNNKDYGYNMLDTECLNREVNSLELAVEILKIVKVPNKVKKSLIHLKYHSDIVNLTSSISEELHNSKTFRRKLIDRGLIIGDDDLMVFNNKQNGTEYRKHHKSMDNEMTPNESHREKNKRIRRSAEPMVDSLDDFSKRTIEFLKQFDHRSPLYILNKTNGEELMYYYSVNTILNEKYSHGLSEDLKCRMDEIAKRIPDILLKFEILKNADHSLVEELLKSKFFEGISVPYLSSGHMPQDKKFTMNIAVPRFERSADDDTTNHFKADIPVSRFKRQENSTILSEKLNSNVTLIDSILLRHIENGSLNKNETRKKLQCFMENDDFKNVLLTIQILEEHLKSLVNQNTSLPSSAMDSEHELAVKIQEYMNYHAIKVIKTFNNVKSNFGKALANMNTKMLSKEAENYNSVSEILSSAGYIPCSINSKIKCINAAIAEIKEILDTAREFIAQQITLSSSPYVEYLCKENDMTNPMQGQISNSLDNPELEDNIDSNSSDLLTSNISPNQSHVTMAIYYLEETISYLYMFKKINPLPVQLMAGEVQPSQEIMSHLKDVDSLLDSIIQGKTHFLNETHLITSINETQLPLIFLKLKNAMAILDERESFHAVGLQLLDTIFGTINVPGNIDIALHEMEKKKQKYEQVLSEMKSDLPEIELDEHGQEVAVAPEKLVIPVDHDRFSTVSGMVAGYNLQDVISRLYINESAHKFLEEFDISNVHNITISGSLTVLSHINGISPSILHRACPLSKPFNNITFVFRKPVIIQNNLLAYYVSSIPFENYATTVGKHVFYKDTTFVGGVKFQDNVLVRDKVNDHELYLLATNVAQKDKTNHFKGNLTFNRIKTENINAELAIVQNVDLNDLVTLNSASIITGDKTFSYVVTNENLTADTMETEYIDTKYNSNIQLDKIFQNNLLKNSSDVQVLSGVQVFRNLTFNVDVDVSVGIFDYTLNSLSKRVVYKDKTVKLSNDLKTFDNTQINNLTFSSFDNVTSLESWLMKDGDQTIESFSSFNKLKAKVVKLKNDIVMSNDNRLNFNYFVSNTIKIDEPSNLQYNILWNSIKVEESNLSVDGLVQGVDISEETVVEDSVDVTLGGNKYFEKAVNFNNTFDIEGLFNGRNLTLFCSDKYFHNLTVDGSWIMEKIVKTINVTCHSRELPEKNWASCWQADKNHTIIDNLNIAEFEMVDGSFSSLSSNINLSTFQNEILWKKSNEAQSMKCAANLSTVNAESLQVKSLTTYKLMDYFANDLYDMLTRSDDQNITGLYDLYSVLMIEKMVGPDELNYVTLDHFCQHSKFCKVFAKKSMQGLYIEEFLKPHTDCVIQGIDISEWWEKATKTDSSPKDLQNTKFVNLKIINGLVTTGLVDGVDIQSLLQKSADQTIEATLVLDNTNNDVLMLHKLNISDGEINDYNLVQLLDRMVYVDKPAVIQGSTRFYNETYFSYANYSEQLTSLKKAVDWIIDESSVIHLRNEVVTLSHLAMFANEALPRQPVKFEGWTVVQELTGMYHRIKALDFERDDSSPGYLALLSWYGPIILLEINDKTDTYDPSGFQIAGNCTTSVSSLRNNGNDYIINSNACGLENFISTMPKTVGYAFPFGTNNLNISLGFSLIWKMNRIEGPELLWCINTLGACDHQIMELQDNLCILFICHQGFDLKIMCLENDKLNMDQQFKLEYPIFKASAISYTNEIGENKTFLAMVDSQGLNLYLYEEDHKHFELLETKLLQQLIWVDLVYHNGDLFISTISSGFRGLEKGMIYVYKLDFNHLEMQYNHTSVLMKFISLSPNVTTPELELYSSIPEDMPLECHFTKLQTGELSLFVTSGTGVITRLSHRGVEGFRRSGDVLVPGSTTLEVWNSYRKGRIFTRLAPSGFPKMKPQKTVIMESSYLENTVLNTDDDPKCDIRDLPFLTVT